MIGPVQSSKVMTKENKMSALDNAIKTEGEAAVYQERLAAAVSNETNNLFAMIEEAEQEHHDALVEFKGDVGLQRRQFRLLQGAACLLKTSPGKA